MAQNNETLRLDLGKDTGTMQTVYLGQGDKNGTVIRAEVTDGGEVPASITGNSCTFEMMLPDFRHYYAVDGTLTVDGSHAYVEATVDESYAAAVPGVTEVAYFSIKDGDTVIASTERFRVVCLRSANYGAEPGGVWTNGIQEALDAFQEEIDAMGDTFEARIATDEGRIDAAAASIEGAVARANAAAEAAEGAIINVIPTMSTTVKGGAKVGTGLEMNSDKLQVSQAIQDSISRLSGGGKVSTTTDWDALDPGAYYANGIPDDLYNTGASKYGALVVLKGARNYGVQFYFSHSGYGPRYRTNFGSGWNTWRAFVA